MKWSNVEGCAVITFDDEPPAIIEPFGAKLGDQLLITFLSSGYYEPMSMYGGSDHVGWPEEGDDERIVTAVVLHTDDKEVEIPKELFDKISDLFNTDIYGVELDSDEPDYDRYDD